MKCYYRLYSYYDVTNVLTLSHVLRDSPSDRHCCPESGCPSQSYVLGQLPDAMPLLGQNLLESHYTPLNSVNLSSSSQLSSQLKFGLQTDHGHCNSYLNYFKIEAHASLIQLKETLH